MTDRNDGPTPPESPEGHGAPPPGTEASEGASTGPSSPGPGQDHPYPAPGQPYPGQPYPGQPFAPGQPQQPDAAHQPDGAYQPGQPFPAGQPYQPYQPGQPYPPQPQPPAGATDSVSVGALITGVLGGGVIALVLGILGLRRTANGARRGRGMAIAGTVLGGVGILVWLLVVVLIATAGSRSSNDRYTNAWTSTAQENVDTYADGCRDGDMSDCDSLWIWADPDSEEEALAESCNGLGSREEYGSCYSLGRELETATAYGDDATLDGLYDSCQGGDMAACDDLYYQAPPSTGTSEYREFGSTCGGTASADDGSGWCEYEATYGEPEDAAVPDEDMTLEQAQARMELLQTLIDTVAPPEASQNYGDNYLLDSMWDACTAGNDNQCAMLYLTSSEGSTYRAHAQSCGGRGAQPGVCGP